MRLLIAGYGHARLKEIGQMIELRQQYFPEG